MFITIEIAKYLMTFLHYSRTLDRTVAKIRTWGMNTWNYSRKGFISTF
jgi:hypothetical protein